MEFHLIKKSKRKESRWNRIRKKHLNNLTVTTNTVRRFINMNFVGEADIKAMSELDDGKKYLNPVVVMNLRHEMIRNKSNIKKPDITPAKEALKQVKENEVQARIQLRQKNLIESELNKFRKEMNTRPKSRASARKSHLLINLPTKLDSFDPSSSTDNNLSTKTSDLSAEELELETEEYINRFYSELITVSPSEKGRLTTTPQSGSIESLSPENKMVRFGDAVQVITYEKEPSISSISTLSTNSDLHLEEMNDSEIDHCSNGNANTFGIRHLNIDHFEPDMFKSFSKKITTKYEANGYYYSENTIEMTDNFLKITKYENCRKCEEINYYGEHIFDEDREDHFAEIVEIEPDSSETKRYVSRENEYEQQNDTELMLIKKIDIEPKDYSKLIVRNGYRFEEKDKIIEELFEPDALRSREDQDDENLLRWALNLWHQKTVIAKITRENTVSKKDRFKKINEFLNKINIEKRHFFNEAVRKAMAGQKYIDSVTLKKNYEHKLKIQQDIIDLQKLKLSRQERIIAELKLHKLSDEAKIAKEELKTELHRLAKRGDIKLRARVKSIQIAGNIKDELDEDEARKLQAQGLVVPTFLAKMQERAMERTMKHQEAKERREKLEQEKEDARLAAEEAKRQLDEEAKRKRIEELREKRRQEKIDRVQREKDRVLYIEGMKKAKEFYTTLLMRKGIRRLKFLIEIRRLSEIKADLHYKKHLMKICFSKWSAFTRTLWNERNEKAQNFYRLYVLRIAYRLWKDYYLLQQSKLLVAIDWYELQITSKIIKVWHEKTVHMKKIELVKIQRAEAHYHWQLKWKVLVHWQRLPAINKIEKETEERRQKWRLKIMELCPDYTPKHWSDDDDS